MKPCESGEAVTGIVVGGIGEGVENAHNRIAVDVDHRLRDSQDSVGGIRALNEREKSEFRDLVITVGGWILAALSMALLIAALAGCQFHLLPNGLWGVPGQTNPVPRGTVQPPDVQTPSGQGNGIGGDSGDWSWASDPALWGSLAVGIVYVANQVRKSKKYGSSRKD